MVVAALIGASGLSAAGAAEVGTAGSPAVGQSVPRLRPGSAVAVPAPTAAPQGAVLRAGSTGAAVPLLQKALHLNGFRDYYQSPYSQYFDALTGRGLLTWERANVGKAGVVADAAVTVGSPEWLLLITQQSDYVPPAPPKPVIEAPAVCFQKANIVCASKKEQLIRYFESGSLVMTIPARYGRPGYDTPTGTWTVKIKDPNAISYAFDNASMPYSLEYDLERGIYIHYSYAWAAAGDGPYVGSHGCINIKDWNAIKTLFYRAPIGTTVHVY